MPRIDHRDSSIRSNNVGDAHAERADAVRTENAPGVLAPPVGRPSGAPVDAMDALPAVSGVAVAAPEPYAKLAALGAFKGHVPTAAGDVYVEIVPGKDAGKRPPIVYLDGLDACGRELPTDETVVNVHLIGQLHTLARDIEKNGARSLERDIDPDRQVEAVVGALDALGVDKPVHLFGLSYGGMIAALTKKAHPERVDHMLLCAPYAHSVACGDPVRDMVHAFMTQNPLNAMGQWLYRAAARAALAGAMATVPPALLFQAPLYAEAMYRMSMGLEGKRLDVELAGMENVHVLVTPGDVMSPPHSSKIAHDKAKSGTFTVAPLHLTLQHDLIRMAPSVVRDFIDASLPSATSPASSQEQP